MITLEKIHEVSEADPDRPGIFCQGKLYSYGQLADTIGSVQSAILKAGFSGEDKIGVLSGDDLLTYASVFAVLANGSAYVPLNCHNPPDRVAAVMEDAGLRLVLASREHGPLRGAIENVPGPVTILDTVNLPEARGFSPHSFAEDQLVYLLFTSGSTGRPKGVPIYYSNLKSYLETLTGKEIHQFSEEDRFLQMFELTFDFSVMSVFTPFSIGASCFVVPEKGFVYMNIIRLLTEQRITVAPMVPSALAYMSRFFHELQLGALRFSIFCGEALPDQLVREWAACIPNARIQNCYGPTEATVYCMSYDWHLESSPSEAFDGIVPIGTPFRNTSVLLVGEDEEEVLPGERGELCLSGPQVTPHYWQDPAKTKSAFLQNRRTENGFGYYRTGDLCFLNESGDLVYCGRIDSQVKIDGHRIELGEIEHHAREFTGMPLVAVVPVGKGSLDTTLLLFIQGEGIDLKALAEHLGRKLPGYMQPRRIIPLPEMPLNPNGKIDRPLLRKSWGS